MGALIEQRPNGQTCVRSVLFISNPPKTNKSLGINTLFYQLSIAKAESCNNGL